MESGWKERIDNTKWILTLLIVLYHIQLLGSAEGLTADIFMYIKNLGDCVVPAFALISGYLFFYNADSFASVKAKMYRRIWTLLIPYLAWNLLNSLYLIVRNNGVRGFFGGLLTFNWYRHCILWDASPHFWYIFMLMFWTVLAPVLYILIKDKRLIWILFLTQIVYLIYKGPDILHSRFIYILYTWGGVIGYYLPDLAEKFSDFIIGNKQKTVLFLSGTMYFAARFMYVNIEDNNILVWCYALRGVILIVFLMSLPIAWVGAKTQYAYSFWLFAIHFYLDIIVGRYLSSRLPVLISQISSWVIVVCVGLASGVLVHRFLPYLFMVFTGKRKKRE